MSDSEEDEEIDEGFKIPGRIWSKLFKYGWFGFMVFSATFNNISVLSWR